jgi:hypothetical protein
LDLNNSRKDLDFGAYSCNDFNKDIIPDIASSTEFSTVKELEKPTFEELNTVKNFIVKRDSPMPQKPNKEILEEAVETHIKIA